MEPFSAFLVALGLNLGILVLLQKRYEPQVYRAVGLTFLGTTAVRYMLAAFLWFKHDDPGFANMFWGDSGTYDAFGAAIAEGWSQGVTLESWTNTLEGKVNSGFIYLVACIYYLFGRNTLLMQFINGTIGALTPIVIFEIGLLLYDRRVAARAMYFTAFFPQMIFWSAAIYKDATVMLCIALNMLATLRMKQRFALGWLLLYMGTAGALVYLRFYIFYAIMAATLAGFLISKRRGLVFALFSQIVVVSGVILLLLFTPAGKEMQAQQRFLDLQALQNSRDDLALRGESGFAVDADVSTPSGLLRFLPIGVAYLLFAPFPWAVGNLRQALAMPDVLMWYALMLALVRGLHRAIRERLGLILPILVFTTSLTLAYGAFLGNTGTAYRQRAQVMMFYFIFIADGLKKRNSQTLDEMQIIETAEAKEALAP